MAIPQLVAATLLVVACVVDKTALGACLPSSGPPGDYDCFQSRYYDYKSQWGTCVTNVYMKQKSKGRHLCRGSSAIYCYYQCMLEVHNQDNGNVTSDCACDVSMPMTTSQPETSTLPSSCYSPNGTECGWFQNCLNAKFNCSDTAEDYGIRYGEAFCNLYQKSYPSLSTKAREWVDAVRRCLQVELVPFLRPFDVPSCADIKTKALTSHTGCYVTPYAGGLNTSICQLSFMDFWKVFWILRTSFKLDFSESVLQLMKENAACRTELKGGIIEVDRSMRSLMMQLKITPPQRRKKRFDGRAAMTSHTDDVAASLSSAAASGSSGGRQNRLRARRSAGRSRRSKRQSLAAGGQQNVTTPVTELRHHLMAGEAGRSLAGQLRWEEQGVLWFAYGRYLGDHLLQVYILLADKGMAATSHGPDVAESANVTKTDDVNMTAIVTQAADAYERRAVTIHISGLPVTPGVLSLCGDTQCQDVTRNVTARPMVASPARASVWCAFDTKLAVAYLCFMVTHFVLAPTARWSIPMY